MDTNFTGSWYGNRQGSPVVRFTYVTPAITDTTTKFARIKASTSNPVIVQASICVLTIDATETVSIGITASGTELVNAASLGTAATGGTFLPAANDVGKYYLTADADLYYTGSSGADTGVIAIILDITEVNTSLILGI